MTVLDQGRVQEVMDSDSVPGLSPSPPFADLPDWERRVRAIHRAVCDPGAVLPRGTVGQDGKSDYSESLPSWQTRAVMAALADLLIEDGEPVLEPHSYTARGFAVWADFTDLYGKTFTVQQSSLADEPAVWVGAGEERGHLSVEMAEHVQDALCAFIAGARRAEEFNVTPVPKEEGP